MPVEERVFSGDQVRHDGVKNIPVRDPIPNENPKENT